MDFATFAGLENLRKRSLLQKTCWCLEEKSSLSENVSRYNLLWLENSATGFPVPIGSRDELGMKFLVQTDKLSIVLHLLLVQVQW